MEVDSSEPTTKAAIIFGGSGFVGTHLVRYLLEQDPEIRLLVADLVPPRIEHERVSYIPTDPLCQYE